MQKKSYVVRVSKKTILAEEQRSKIKANFKVNISKRAAIEGTNSAIKRGHGADDIKVKGLNKCNVVMGLKITAHNFKQLAKQILNKAKELIKKPYPDATNGITMPV